MTADGTDNSLPAIEKIGGDFEEVSQGLGEELLVAMSKVDCNCAACGYPAITPCDGISAKFAAAPLWPWNPHAPGAPKGFCVGGSAPKSPARRTDALTHA